MTQFMAFPNSLVVTLLTSLLILPCVVVAGAQRADSAAARLRAAIDREMVDGDIRGAIKDYQAIVDTFGKTDRATAAQALMRMADAHQRLGSAEASRIYREIVRDYAEQKELVSAARAKLAALRPAAAPRGSGPVCASCVGPFFHSFTLSPDGRWLGYTAANNDLMSRNLQTGEVKRLVGFPAESYSTGRFRARRATLSRDSRQVAYFFRDTDAPGMVKDRAQLRVLTIDAESEPRTLVDNPDFIYVLPAAWSLDGQSILVTLQRRDFTWQFAWVSASTGAITVVRSLDWQYNEFRSGPELSADGRYIVYATFTAPRTSPGPDEGPRSGHGGQGRTLHILSADGSGDSIISAAASGWTSPVWSPDGSRVLFVSNRDNSETYDLWAVEVRDGRPIGLPSLVKASIGANVNLVGTARSGLLYYVQPESTSRRIVVADLKTDGTPNMSGPTTGSDGSNATWSPDGKRLAWLTLGQLKVQSLETGHHATYALPQGAFSGQPSWQHDGSAVIVAFRNRETGGGLTIARVILDSSEVRILGTYEPPDEQGWNGQFTPAPDGTTIFVAASAGSSRERSLIALDLASRTATPVLSGLTGMVRLQQAPRRTVGQAVEIMSQPVPVIGLAPRSDGHAIAVTLMKDAQTYLASFSTETGTYRELYGPVPARQWKNTLVSRLGDPTWLHKNLGVAFGIQQDDLSWKLLRVADDGRTEPLGSGESFLPPGTLRFDISPDGRRVAYERLMTFNDELWALDLRTLSKAPR